MAHDPATDITSIEQHFLVEENGRRGGILSSVRNLFILVSMGCKCEMPMCTNGRKCQRTLFRRQKLTEAGDEEIAWGRIGRNARERDPRADTSAAVHHYFVWHHPTRLATNTIHYSMYV
jgi:hypothetical protein